jgi:hypothetical protein
MKCASKLNCHVLLGIGYININELKRQDFFMIWNYNIVILSGNCTRTILYSYECCFIFNLRFKFFMQSISGSIYEIDHSCV